MKTQHFDILIRAPRERVWTTMLQSPTYEQWTRAFCEGSRFEGSWKAGDAIRFLDPAGNGMVSEGGGTRVKVDADVFGAYEDMMARTWPQALDSLKTLCEGTN
ncbi:hypothetical protein [Hydrogenophaga sp.]|uniref:hypothetical protein n=1 Tax=Hydrogenophaga sp. TaxID=1904254 RepID=UPI00272F5B02|nr:hypothetical protein [Hydrogenophaga sp.]MDP2017553.1 hypothetical protein [Hydrogenophaga sp.]